ncbi:MAG: ferrochelatase [Desulfurella sp.]|uniref:ferrochelatase n=1 Tax=Desulfurella sp. TaxID=1962857 RepID=UPI000CC227B0|nr:ferrochelatase [Desulfurella sp.]PMP90453.1 MAG: ferrochelatase [Desulfurella sp.]HEX13814.1 ferrochelatase [Desulfurella acetivorans]
MNITIANLGYISKKTECFSFLHNMFDDPYISNIQNALIRKIFATLMLSRAFSSCKILKVAPSPLLEITKSQANKLQKILNTKVNYCFSYSKPFCKDKNTIMFPLYTIYSKTLYGILFETKPKKILPPLCSFAKFIDFYIQKLKATLNEIYPDAVIFSNHSLPLKLAKKDSYEKDTYIFCNFLAKNLNLKEYYVSFQSKLGPIAWLEPTTTDTLKNLKNKTVLIVPVSFVTDNTETIYEIDYTYAQFAKKMNINLFRFKCFNDDDDFIEVLSSIVSRYI